MDRNNVMFRYAMREDLPRINELREMVNKLHVQGRPDIFRPGFCQELRDYLYEIFEDEKTDVVVAVVDGQVAGFVVGEIIQKPESPFNLARQFYRVAEFGVDESYRRRGLATGLIDFCKQRTRELGLTKIELDMWEFNQSALEFYEAVGFETYRRYMELDL